MPSTFSFIIPNIIRFDESEEKGKLTSPPLKYTAFPILLKQAIDAIDKSLLSNIERQALNTIIGKILETNPISTAILKQIRKEYPNLDNPVFSKALITVAAQARNQSITIAIQSELSHEAEQLQFLKDSQIVLKLMDCIQIILSDDLYLPAFENHRAALLIGLFSTSQNILYNISSAFYAQCYLDHYKYLIADFTHVSCLSVSSYMTVCDKLKGSNSHLDKQTYVNLFLFSKDWNFYLAQYYFSLGENEKAVNHLALERRKLADPKLANSLKLMSPLYTSLYSLHSRQKEEVKNLVPQLEPLYKEVYDFYVQKHIPKIIKLREEILACDPKNSAYAQLYVYTQSDFKTLADDFMTLFIKQSEIEFQMSGKIECANLFSASEVTNTNLPAIKQRFRFLIAAKARAYDQDFNLIVNCKIIMLHLKGTLEQDKENIFAKQLQKFLLEYEGDMHIEGAKIQESQAKIKSPDKPLPKAKKEEIKPAVKAAPQPISKPAPEAVQPELASQLTSQIAALEKTNADLNASITTNQTLNKEKQDQINTQIAQLKQKIQETTALEASFKQKCLEAETLQTQALQEKVEQRAALQKRIEYLKKENHLLNKPYPSPEAVEQERQRIDEIHQQQIDDLKAQQLACGDAQKEQTKASLQIETQLREISAKAQQQPIQSNQEKAAERTALRAALNEQLEELRLENLRLHLANKHFEDTVKTLSIEKSKLELKEKLAKANFNCDLEGYINIANRVRKHLQPPPPIVVSQSYAPPPSGGPTKLRTQKPPLAPHTKALKDNFRQK